MPRPRPPYLNRVVHTLARRARQPEAISPRPVGRRDHVVRSALPAKERIIRNQMQFLARAHAQRARGGASPTECGFCDGWPPPPV